MAKKALLIGISDYKELPRLPAAIRDINAVGKILEDPEIGGFDEVKLLPNPDADTMRVEALNFYQNCRREDLVLLFFSGHGLKDDKGNLYFAAINTRMDAPTLTSVSAHLIFNKMLSEDCRSKRQVVILDCCYSGAALAGVVAKNAEVNVSSNIKELAIFTKPENVPNGHELGGEGRVVLTSSTSTQISLAEDEISKYTEYLVEGLETGAADREGNGVITTFELHRYVKERIQAEAPRMTPEFYPSREGFEIIIAQSLVNDRLKYLKRCEEYVNFARQKDLENFRESARLKKFVVSIRSVLDDLRKILEISDSEADEIEQQVLEPYTKLYEKLAAYRSRFEKEVKQNYPLSDSQQFGLDQYRRFVLYLEREQIEPIEQDVLQQRKTERDSYLESFKQATWQDPPFEQTPRSELYTRPERKWFVEKEINQLERKICLEKYSVEIQKLAEISERLELLQERLNLPTTDVQPLLNAYRQRKRRKWLMIIAGSGTVATLSLLIILGFLRDQEPVLSCKALPAIANESSSAPVEFPSGSFRVGGSTTWAPIFSESMEPGPQVTEDLEEEAPDFQLQLSELSGSGNGIREVANGQLDFSVSSRPLENSEKDDDLENIMVATDAIAIVLHPGLDISGLTTAQLKGIFLGEIDNWQEVGGPNLEIKAYSRGGESGTVEAFRESILDREDFSDRVDQSLSEITGPDGLLSIIRDTPGSISFLSYPEVQSNFARILPIGERPDNFIDLTNGYTSTYTSCLTRNLFVIVTTDPSRQNARQAGEAYANFLRTNKIQEILATAGYGRVDGQ